MQNILKLQMAMLPQSLMPMRKAQFIKELIPFPALHILGDLTTEAETEPTVWCLL